MDKITKELLEQVAGLHEIPVGAYNIRKDGELYGRITSVSWGMVFPHAEKFSSSLPWVKDFMQTIGMNASTNLVNLPRHPSQLYEALFEGLILFSIIWILHKKKPFDGFSSALYTSGYGFFRFFIEYFREPDADIGYRIAAETNAPIYMNTSLFNISTGQILCFLMILGGIGIALTNWLLTKRSKNNE